VFHKNVYEFDKLFKVWAKGARGRLNMIKLGKKDLFSLLFKFNIPLLYSFLIVIFGIVSPPISIVLVTVAIFFLSILSVKSYIETKLMWQNFFVKILMDSLSLFIINIFVFYYKIVK
nr:hypothetical protein [Candidatus Paceibacterota bacterium]